MYLTMSNQMSQVLLHVASINNNVIKVYDAAIM